MTPDRELRVCTVVIDGVPWIQIGHWRRKGPVLLATGSQVLIDGRHVDALAAGVEDARKMIAGLGRQT